MLDDLKLIHERDPQDALGIAEKQGVQLTQNFQIDHWSATVGQYENVVFAGMGGSALAALISRSWPAPAVPFEVCRQYHIPAYVSERTLFVASSYSGNTEETLSALAEAEQRHATIVVIAGGGQLIEIAQAKSYPHIVLPKVGQPRYAVLYSFNALVTILVAAGLADAAKLEQLQRAAPFLEQSMQTWLPTVPQDKNPAKKLALELIGKSIVLYAGPVLSPAAYKWKISFNENAKNIAWWNEYSEWNHNETSGWLGQPTEKPYAVIELRSNLEHPQIQKRYAVMEKLLSGKRPAPNVVQAEGSDPLEQLLWTVLFGDFVSLYLAILNNINPTPVDVQEKLKDELTVS